VRIRGYLAKYGHDQGFERGTSTIRTDTGNGACETIFITDYEIIASYGGPWPTINTVSAYGLLGTMLLLGGRFVYRLFKPESIDDVDRFLNQAAERAERGALREALGLLDTAHVRNPHRDDVLQARAAVHEALGNSDAAGDDRRAASRLGGQPFAAPAAPASEQVPCAPVAGFRPPWLDEDEG
jgi:hypothetical protein